MSLLNFQNAYEESLDEESSYEDEQETERRMKMATSAANVALQFTAPHSAGK